MQDTLLYCMYHDITIEAGRPMELLVTLSAQIGEGYPRPLTLSRDGRTGWVYLRVLPSFMDVASLVQHSIRWTRS